jgi:invasion protein IalB
VLVRIKAPFRILAAAALGMLLVPYFQTGTFAQQQQQPGKTQFGPRANKQPGASKGMAAEVVATHGSWKIQCEVPAKGQEQDGQAAGQKQCGMVQVTRSEKNQKIALSLVIVKAKQGDKNVVMMRVIAPIGVYLPTGVALEIDGGAVGRVPFTRCLPQICIAFAEASKETLEKMRKGNAANFIIYEAPGLGLPMKISLDGFSKAMAALDAL